MKEKGKLAILILAAGASTRMGDIKQLLPWKNTSLLGNAIQQAKSTTIDAVYVILGANAQEIKNRTKDEVAFIENVDWKYGLGSSISCGINTILSAESEYSSVLIMLADQPLIDTTYLNDLIDAYSIEKKGIVATNYGNRVGVPAIFSSNYFIELLSLNKDYGARSIIKNNENDIFSILPKGKELDIDTLEDYKKLTSHLK